MIRIPLPRPALGLLAVLLAGSAQATDMVKGEKLFKRHCQACHISLVGGDGSTLHTRAERKVHNLAGLTRQVNFCKDNLDLQWFDDQVESVVDYLNRQYYRFESKS